MDKAILFAPVLLFLFTILYYAIPLRNMKKYQENKSKLPPGSMGWPYFGETLQLYSQSPNVFFSDRQRRFHSLFIHFIFFQFWLRFFPSFLYAKEKSGKSDARSSAKHMLVEGLNLMYGEIFKTRILGCPCVMLTSPEAVRLVMINQANLFKPTYPKTKEDLIGPWALFFHQNEYHIRLRKLVRASLCPVAIRSLVADIEDLTVSALNSMANGKVINTFNEMKRLSFEVGILAIFAYLEPHYKEELRKNYIIVDRGYNSFPTNLPGTRYRKAMKARKRLSEILNSITRERKEKKLPAGKDLLSCLLNSKNENDETLSEDQIADNIIGVLFAAQDTTASALTWIIKYLHDNPKLLEAVKAEQMEIYMSNGCGMRNLTWNQTRTMPVTYKVILESLRMASIISFTFREAVTDVEYNGYLIPKGWKVMPLFRNIHRNPEFFTDPQKFDPSRFKGTGLTPNTFMPFGSGVHACPGNQLAKLEMLIMLHHLTSRFRYELVGSESDGIQYGPFPVPLHGLPARFWKQEDSTNSSMLQLQDGKHAT